MGKGRLEAFSDGVIAIIITIMVLEMDAPHGATLDALLPVLPAFFSYVLSFIYIGIYWSNHHHLLQACGKVNGRILWANLHLLFWLSLLPFATAWMGENHFTAIPSVLYGSVLLMAAVSYWILQHTIITSEGGNQSLLKKAIGRDWKGKLSPFLYIVAILSSFRAEWLAEVIYIIVACLWLIPDRRIERALKSEKN